MVEYYLFALFVFVLLCIIIFLCKFFFTDAKRQKKLLDEKETKLLRLYQSLEDILDGFYDSVAQSKQEMKDILGQAQAISEKVEKTVRDFPPPMPMIPPVVMSPAPAAPPAKPPQKSPAKGRGRKPKASAQAPQSAKAGAAEPAPAAPPEKDLLAAAGFPQYLKETEEDPVQAAELQLTRHASILSLSEQGKNRHEIAQELGITLSEVDLVIGISKK